MEFSATNVSDSSLPEKRILDKMAIYFDTRHAPDLSLDFVRNRDFDSVRLIIQMKIGYHGEEFPTRSMFMACFFGGGYLDYDNLPVYQDFTMADFIMQHSSHQQRSSAFQEAMRFAVLRNNSVMEKIDFLLTLRAKYEIEVDDILLSRNSKFLTKEIVDKLLRNGYEKQAHHILFKCIASWDVSDNGLECQERSRSLIEEFGISLTEHGPTALQAAVVSNNHLMIAFLVAQGVDINSSEMLNIAIGLKEKGNHNASFDTMKMLLEHGARIEQVRTMLPRLQNTEDEARLGLLFQYGAQFDYKGLWTRATPRFVEFLLKNDDGAARNLVFIDEVFYACCGTNAYYMDSVKCMEILTMLINAGVDFTKLEPINKKKCYKDVIALRFGKLSSFTSPLGQAVAKNDEKEFTKLISSKGVKRKLDDMPHWNALHVAADYGRTEMARKMVALGADTNALTPDGLTAFHLAAAAGHSDTLLAMMKP